MKIEYIISENDFLNFQLFTASQSPNLKKQKLVGLLILVLGFLAVAVYFYLKNNTVLTAYFTLVAIASLLFYKNLYEWRLKKHFQKYLKEHYINRFDEKVTLAFDETSIFSKDKTGEARINITEVEQINETVNYLFVKLYSGVSLIIPKKQLEDITTTKQYLEKLNLKIVTQPNWKW